MMECTLILFEALFRIEGMQEALNLSMGGSCLFFRLFHYLVYPAQISSFVRHLRQIYRLENSYHNFEHALDVLQATQCYLRSAGMVPPLTILKQTDQKWSSGKPFDSDKLISCLGLKDLFVLYIAAIGHDAGHPGFSNIFMVSEVLRFLQELSPNALLFFSCSSFSTPPTITARGSLKSLDSPIPIVAPLSAEKR